MAKYNFNDFQIPHTGLDNQGPLGDQQTRVPEAMLSNFGALNYGNRDSSDYTQVAEGFKSKDEWQNPDVPLFQPTGNGGNVGNAVNNPFASGSSVHKVRADELAVMTLGSRKSMGIKQPMMDTMDTDLVWDTTISGTPNLNFPTEGYKFFGGRTGGPFAYSVGM